MSEFVTGEAVSSLPLPPPPVPSDLDIRRLWWMKLDIGALLNSEFNTMTSDDTAWRAGVTLWCRAWHQVPAGSLPDDDRALCHLAGLGRDLVTWGNIRANALHGFIRCADGRLYHLYLCKMALEAYDEVARSDARRQRDRDRKGRISTGVPRRRRNSRGKFDTGQDTTGLIPPNPPERGAGSFWNSVTHQPRTIRRGAFGYGTIIPRQDDRNGGGAFRGCPIWTGCRWGLRAVVARIGVSVRLSTSGVTGCRRVGRLSTPICINRLQICG